MKKVDSIYVLLIFFTFFLVVLFLYLSKVNENIEVYSTYDDTIHELKSIDGKFDNFLLKQAVFINFDEINKNMYKFDKAIKFLDSKESHELHCCPYEKLLQKIKDKYMLKKDSIEYFKSDNAQFLDSMHYLFELNQDIAKSNNLDKNSIDTANKILLDLMKFYINDNINFSNILIRLEYLSSKIKNDNQAKIYIKHVRLNIKRIKKFKQIKNLQNKNKLIESINNLHTFLKNNYQHNILIEKIIITILFVVALVILVILIIMNRRSIIMKNELFGFKTAIENSYNSIVITDVDSNIIYVNEVAEVETGYSKEELIGKNPRVLKSGLNDERFYAEMHQALDAGEKWEGEFINKKKDGSLLYEKASIMPIYQDGEIVNYLAIKLNITDYVEEKEKVKYMAYHDSLTSLPNRMNIEEYTKKRLSVVNRNNTKLSILFIDFDRFKIINDTLGHDVGDELLIESSKRIKSALRDSDILARVGGDEFVIIVESSDNIEYSSAHICEKILELFKKPIQTKSNTLSITLSIGVAVYPDDATDYNQLLKYADIAMYEAKSDGKNTYRYYQEKLSIDAHNRLEIEQALKGALVNSEFYMMYQPKYNISDKTIVDLEALVRWENPKIGFISPDKFIPISEDTGYIIEIGLFIFEQSCKDYLIFKQKSKTLKNISINISTVQLYQGTFIDEIMKIVKDVGISPKEIKLEITETHLMKNIKHSIKLLQNLKDLGFSISVDDFGTGYSSLNYLKLFPIDELKIDKSFIDDIPHDKSDVAITKAIIALSQTMGYENVAEGIETDKQEEFLKNNGCKIGQGYYFSKPKVKDDLIEFLQNNI